MRKWISEIWQRWLMNGLRAARPPDTSLKDALDTLAAHGMEAHHYLPAVGHRDNPALSHALTVAKH